MIHAPTSIRDLRAPVSAIMTKNPMTVNPRDSLMTVKSLVDHHRIHHVPVVHANTLVGMISKSDLLHFMNGMSHTAYDKQMEVSRLINTCAGEIMTTGLATLETDDKINVAVEIFRENLFHAIPIMQGGQLAGLVTTHDLIQMLAQLDDQRIAEGYQRV